MKTYNPGRHILGRQVFESNDPRNKRVILTFQITLLILAIGVIYIFFDLLMGIVDSWPVYLFFSVLMVVNLYLLKSNRAFLAKHVILIASNLVIYVFYARESYGTGAFLLFFPLITAAFSLFDYKQRTNSYWYSLFSLFLFMLATFSDFTILPKLALDQTTVNSNFVINFFVAGFATIFNIIFLMKINQRSEASLLAKEAALKQLTGKLKESNLRFELALSASKGGVWDWDIESKNIYHSQTWGKQFGFDQFDSTDWTLSETLHKIHPDDRKKVNDLIKDHFMNKTPYVAEYRLLDINHDYRWIVDYGQAIWDENDEPVRMVGFMVDITERKRAEQKIQVQNDMLAKTNSELDRFVYSTSHDLRSPLMSVLGLIQLMKSEESLDEIRKFVQMMELRINHLDSFIQDIIHYSRNSRMDIVPEPVHLKDIVDESLESIKFIEGVERIDIISNVDNLTINTDRSRLKVIVNNLISNAVKYQKRLGRGLINVEVKEFEDLIEINIMDNGEGIKDDKKEKIFNMFYRASENSNGSGLGLYIVKEMVEKLQGRIRVESTYGEGTTFIVTLPKAIKKRAKLFA